MKHFPHCLGAARSRAEFTETEWRWLQCQLLLDDGAHVCAACDAIGHGTYCAACGVRFTPAGAECAECRLPSDGAYCTHCGAGLGSPVAEAIDEGRFNWDAWAQSLRPFLGGLSPTEQQLLLRG